MKMDEERIEKWKCEFCGDRHKKVAYMSKNGKRTGFSMVCCGCGNVNNFALTHDAIPTFAIGINPAQIISDIEIVCGCSEYDISTCTNNNCECRKTQNETSGGSIPREPVREIEPVPPKIKETGKELPILGRPMQQMSETDPESMIVARRKQQPQNTRVNFSDEEVFRVSKKQ